MWCARHGRYLAGELITAKAVKWSHAAARRYSAAKACWLESLLHQASLRLLLRCVAGTSGPGLGCIVWGQWSVGAIQFRQWKCDPAIYRELRSLGAWQQVVQKVAEHSHRCWHNSLPGLSRALNIAWFGCVSHGLEARTRRPGGVAGERPVQAVSLPIHGVAINLPSHPWRWC